MKDLTTKDFYFCYTVSMFNYLRKNGETYILKARSVKDGSIFTLYYKSERLQKLLDDFNNQ